MKNKLIEENYLKLIQKIRKYNKNYYNKNESVITDQDFDLLKKKIIELETDYKFLKNKDSPSISVGFKPSKNFQKVKHKVPMLSLGNAFDEKDLKYN